MTLKNECKRQLMLLPTKVRRAAAAARVCEAVWWGGEAFPDRPGICLLPLMLRPRMVCQKARGQRHDATPHPRPAIPTHTRRVQTRKMPLADFQAAYPGDLQAGALEEIRGRYAAMAAAAAAVQPVPATGRTTRTATKRGGAEPQTVLRTVRARRGPVAPPPKFGEEAAGAAALEPGTAGWPGVRSQLPSPAAVAVATEEAERRSGECLCF